MCRERHRTRDRLLEYDPSIIIPTPHTAGLRMIYPWENFPLSILSEQILMLAKKHGYSGSSSEFWERFSNGSLVIGTINTFPQHGNEFSLYLDKETDILYCYKIIKNKDIDESLIAKIGAAIVGTSIISPEDSYIYLYVPIKAINILEN